MKIKRMRFMTRREWVAKHYPDKVKTSAIGGVLGCPDSYYYKGFTEFQPCLTTEKIPFNSNAEERCSYCWSRPVTINGKYILVRKED